MSENEYLEGGCLCGAVRFRAAGPVLRLAQCHCTDCQALGGGGPSYLVGVARDGLQVLRGRPRGYAREGGSGSTITRYFCADCGTPLYGIPEAFEGLAFLRVGALDSFPDFAPELVLWAESAPSWHVVPAVEARPTA
jgi:hypothetical protein